MQKLIRGIFVFFALAGAVYLTAQPPAPAAPQTPASSAAQPATAAPALTAEEIVSKYVTALGGKETLGQVKSVSMATTAQVMGNDMQGTTTILDGVGYKSVSDFNGTQIVQVYTAKGGWQVNPMAGASDPTPMTDEEYKMGKEQIYIGGPLYDYAAKGNKIELVGNNGDAYKIKLTTKDNVESTYIIDSTTFQVKTLMRKGQMQGQDVDITTNYSDYKKTDSGFILPYTVGVDFGGQFQLTIAVNKVEVNKTVDPAIFDMPAAPAAAPAATAAPKS